MKNKKKYIIITIVIIILAIILPKKISDAIQNEKIFKQYISNGYGVLAETFKVRRKGSNTNTIIRGVNGYYRRKWIRAYEITTPFMDKPFEIWIDNREHYVYGDNFSEVLSNDQKFQHLYSEWIKKQVGIEDENVEFGFTGTFDTPYIEFKKITMLSEDYREVFENTHNFYILQVVKQNIKELEKTNWFNYTNDFTDKYNELKQICEFNPIYDGKSFILYLYKYDANKYTKINEQEYYGTYDKPNNIGTLIENGTVYKNLAEFEILENGIEKKYIIDSNGKEKNDE